MRAVLVLLIACDAGTAAAPEPDDMLCAPWCCR